MCTCRMAIITDACVCVCFFLACVLCSPLLVPSERARLALVHEFVYRPRLLSKRRQDADGTPETHVVRTYVAVMDFLFFFRTLFRRRRVHARTGRTTIIYYVIVL